MTYEYISKSSTVIAHNLSQENGAGQMIVEFQTSK